MITTLFACFLMTLLCYLIAGMTALARPDWAQIIAFIGLGFNGAFAAIFFGNMIFGRSE